MDKRQLGNTCKTAIEIGDVILHKLLEDYNGEELVITQTELLYRLMLITDDYKQFLYNTELYHKNTGIDYKYLNEYRLKVGNQINKRIVNALNRLEKSGYIHKLRTIKDDWKVNEVRDFIKANHMNVEGYNLLRLYNNFYGKIN